MALARLFAWLDRLLGSAANPGTGLVSGAYEPGARIPGTPAARPRSECAALLSVDGGGQFLLCARERLTLGHLRAARADLGFLADVGALHAVIERVDSLQAGPGWRIVPCGDERIAVEGRPVPRGGHTLAPDERVRLGGNLEFRVRIPEAASASAVLELLHGVECAGARHIVLLAPGAGGRVRIGAALAHHVRVAGLEFELTLEWHGGELRLSSQEPLGGALQGASGALAFPPSTRLALTCGPARGPRPPFGFSLEAVERCDHGSVGA